MGQEKVCHDAAAMPSTDPACPVIPDIYIHTACVANQSDQSNQQETCVNTVHQ